MTALVFVFSSDKMNLFTFFCSCIRFHTKEIFPRQTQETVGHGLTLLLTPMPPMLSFNIEQKLSVPQELSAESQGQDQNNNEIIIAKFHSLLNDLCRVKTLFSMQY